MIHSVGKLPRARERVILRVDMNVSFDARGHILDDFRIRESLPTIRLILSRGAKLLIVAHRGDPKGVEARFSVRPIVRHLETLLGEHIDIIRDPVRQNPRDFASSRLLFLENIRFFEGEKKNSPLFARKLARWGKFYVNDAFAVSHRKAASVVALPRLLPSYAGLLLEREVRAAKSLFHPRRPFLVIMGGAKISTKMPYIRKLLRISDRLALAGALYNTVLAAEGYGIGQSFFERVSGVKQLIRNKKLLLPRDVTVLPRLRPGVKPRTRAISEIRTNDHIVDLGPKAVADFAAAAQRAKTVLWNGPLGYMELPAATAGTLAVAKALRHSKAKIIVGGGDLTALFKSKKLGGRNIHLSTGGGALLEFVATGTLPGITALDR